MALRAVIWCAVSTKEQNADDKDSLPSQERLATEWCSQVGAQVIRVLSVPGHSRNYVDIHECANDMAAKNIMAFRELMDLWDRRGFDVLVVRDGNRFARTQSLHAYVTERTISIGARIYSLTDGWVDDRNYRMFIAMNGYKAATDLDAIKKGHEIGMSKRVERGLNVGSLPISHQLAYDARTGKPIRIELCPDNHRLWDDLAQLILEGVVWRDMGRELYERFGHATRGKPFHSVTLIRLVNNPYFWGHSARNYKHHLGIWAFDTDAPLPPGIQINRNTHEPVWTGERADLIKAELRRRKDISGGRASASHTYLFTGLLVCDYCGGSYSVNPNGGYPHWRCHSRHTLRDPNACVSRKVIGSRKVQHYIDLLLREVIKSGDPQSLVNMARTENNSQSRRMDDLASEIEELKQQIDVLISQQIAAKSAGVIELYRKRIEEAGERLEILKQNLEQVQARTETPSQRNARIASFDELAENGVDFLWQMESRSINQYLHRIFGNLRLVVRDGEIIALEAARRTNG